MNSERRFNSMNMLYVSEDKDAIYVQGETFKYGFSKKTGLISILEIMGDNFLIGTDSCIPDIYVSDGEQSVYRAKNEADAECEILSANHYEVHIRSHGLYRDQHGHSFHIRYRITYEIISDGTIFVIVDNKATDSCLPKRLCISSGTFNQSLCKYYSFLSEKDDLGTIESHKTKTIDYTGKDTLFNNEFTPLLWFGNDKSGVEIVLWDIGHQRYGTRIIADNKDEQFPEIDLYASAYANKYGVSYEILSIKDNSIMVDSGWEHTSYFAISINPAKNYNPDLLNLLAVYIHPKDHSYPSDEQIKSIAMKGFNLLVMGINKLGSIIPDNEWAIKRVIETCHEYGIKVLPYLSLMEMSKDQDVIDNCSTEWQIEPSNDNDMISILCSGAEGWRVYWKDRVDKVIDIFDFDGLFFDIRDDKIACRNPLHGCLRKHIRPNFLWLREMLIHAWAKIKSKKHDSIIIAKTDKLNIPIICNWLDIRCIKYIGNDIDILTRNNYFSSYHIGCNSMMYIDKDQEISNRLALTSLLYMAIPVISYHKADSAELEKIFSYWSTYRFFEINKAEWYPAFLDKSTLVKSDSPNLYINIHKNKFVLLTLINLLNESINTNIELINTDEFGLSNGKRYLIFDPIAREIYNNIHNVPLDEIIQLPVSISEQDARMIYICESPENPILLFASGTSELIKQSWNDSTKALNIMLSSQRYGQSQVIIYFPYGEPKHIISDGKELTFNWDKGNRFAYALVKFNDTINNIEVSVSI